MKKQIQVYSIIGAAVAGVSLFSIGQAQDAQIKPEMSKTPAAQTQPLKTMTPISTSPISTPLYKTASWQGQDLALSGTDVVSYHQADAPLVGSDLYVADWDNTTWRFSSEENRDLFVENPEKYVPEFGGYCPVALANNHAKVGLSKHYTVVDEKLYLNYNQEAREEFRTKPKEYIVRAQLDF